MRAFFPMIQSFFGWNPNRKCGLAPVGGQVDPLFRLKRKGHFSDGIDKM